MVPEITARETKKLLDEGLITLLDVRNPEEVKTACVQGAYVIALPDLQNQISSVPVDRPVVTLCHHGRRSQMAADILQANGFEGVRSVKGGIDSWSIDVDQKVRRYE